jgi:hypothetical protein
VLEVAKILDAAVMVCLSSPRSVCRHSEGLNPRVLLRIRLGNRRDERSWRRSATHGLADVGRRCHARSVVDTKWFLHVTEAGPHDVLVVRRLRQRGGELHRLGLRPERSDVSESALPFVGVELPRFVR